MMLLFFQEMNPNYKYYYLIMINEQVTEEMEIQIHHLCYSNLNSIHKVDQTIVSILMLKIHFYPNINSTAKSNTVSKLI